MRYVNLSIGDIASLPPRTYNPPPTKHETCSRLILWSPGSEKKNRLKNKKKQTNYRTTRARPHIREEAVEHADGDSEVQAHEPGARDGRPRPPRYEKSQAPQRPPILDRRQPARTRGRRYVASADKGTGDEKDKSRASTVR